MNQSKADRAASSFIMAGMVASIVISGAFEIGSGSSSALKVLLTGFGSICAVLARVLSAGGDIRNFFFGIIDILVYSLVLLDNQMWAQLSLHLLYFLPMQFIGFFGWRKRGASSRKPVHARRLSLKGWAVTISGLVLAFALMMGLSYFLGKGTGTPASFGKLFLDAMIPAVNIVALILVSRAYMDQWLLWVAVNSLSITLWILNLRTNPANSYTVIVLIKYIFYLLNSLYAIRVWLRLSKQNP